MRVAFIDMNDTSSTCPSDVRTLTSPRRLCSKNIDGGGCSLAVLPVRGVEYVARSLDTKKAVQMLSIHTLLIHLILPMWME